MSVHSGATTTVRQAVLDLLRDLGMTTVFGNPGSTELGLLDRWPADFRYVLGLQEASVVGIADGLAQGLRRPVLVNVHTGAGLGNAMGCVLTAYQNRTPLILTAGQQTRVVEGITSASISRCEPETLCSCQRSPRRSSDLGEQTL